jgi:hypothetical protein
MEELADILTYNRIQAPQHGRISVKLDTGSPSISLTPPL